MSREVFLSQVMPGLKMAAGLILVTGFVRLVFGDPIDKHFIAGAIGGAVALFLCVVFLVPFLAPRVKPNPQILWNAYQRAKGTPGTPSDGSDDAHQDQL